MHAALAREGGVAGRPVARCTVARLMKTAGLRGISRAKPPRTTRPAPGVDTRPDLVQRAFPGPEPAVDGRPDLHPHLHGWVYAAFVLDVYSRRIVG